MKLLYCCEGGGLLALSSLISCDNFLRAGEVKREIEESIAYNNAKEISVLIQPQEGTGSTVPKDNHIAKKGYAFEISFSENPAYSFIKWTAVSKDDNSRAISNGVEFEDPTALKTKVTITNDTQSIQIIPVCTQRIAVSGEPSPRYDPLGVSRDRAITVSFTKPLKETNFIFSQNEIPASANIKSDEVGNIWAYTLDGQTYLKNITITNIDDYSIAEHFTCPVINGNLLTIETDKTNPITFNSSEIFKTVKVTLSKDIVDIDGVKMNSSKTWNYQITEATDEKATVNLTSVAAEGSVYLAGTKDYSIGQKLSLAFTEDADYQFVKWVYDNSIVYIAEPCSANTTATILEKTTPENPTQIKAVCAPRLRVTSFSPINNSSNPTVCKNSSIVITFNHNLSDDTNDLSQLQNISISLGGSPVNTCFKAPVLQDNTVTFIADNSNMLSVPAGQTKTVTVSIPDDFYYILDDDSKTKITYGANGVLFDYKIDETTLNKAEITITAASGSGSLKKASGTNQYSIGQEVPISFEPAAGWQFNGWTITSGNQPVEESKISIADKDSLSTKLIVYEALQGVTVTAKTSECLVVSSVSPDSQSSSSQTQSNPKDSDIVITFNKALDADCSSLLDKIIIDSYDGKLGTYYTQRTLSDKTITIKNTVPISVPKGNQRIITVTVPSDFYYMNDGNKISLEETSFSFVVDYTTIAKSKVHYTVLNGETNSTFAEGISGGTINHQSYEEYNIGEEVALSFEPAAGYQFYTWKLLDSQGNDVINQISYKDTFKATDKQPTVVMNAAEELYINVVCYKRPVISTATVSPYKENQADEVPKNTPIILTFGHAINPATKDEIIINYSAISNFLKSDYFTTSISSDYTTITLTPKKMLPVDHAYETVTVTVPHNDIYYSVAGGAQKITPADSDFTWSYRVNSSTIKKTIVRVDSSEAKANSLTVNGAVISSGATQVLNVEQSMNIEYPLEDGYQFCGWKIVPATSGYTVEPSGYVTSGSIEVKIGEKTFFTLQIPDPSDHPEKAIIKSNDAIANGTADYAITVSAKDFLIPKVTSKLPEYTSEGKDCDSEICIEFNKEMNQVNLKLYSTVSGADNSNSAIQIVDPSNPDDHFENYFNQPVWNGNTLKIKPKNGIRSLLSGETDLKNLKIVIDYSKVIDTNGLALKSDPSWIYRINYHMETVKPTVTGMKLSKPQFELARHQTSDGNYEYYAKEKSASDLVELSDKVFSSFVNSNDNSNTYKLNHVGNKIYFSASVSDSGSGYKGLTIKEKRIRTVDDVTVDESCDDFTYPATKTVFVNEPYVLQSPKDGVIQLDFIFEDYALNKTTKTYYVIRDTAIDASSALKNIINGYTTTEIGPDGEHVGSFSSNYLYYQISSQEVITNYMDNNGYITEQLNFSNRKDKYYSNNSTDYYSTSSDQKKEISYKIEWGYSKDGIIKQENPNLANNVSNSYCKFSFNRDVTNDCFIRITAMDDVGNFQSIIRVIPGKVSVSYMQEDGDNMNIYLNDIAFKDSKVAGYGAKSFNYLLVYTYQEDENSTPTEFRARRSRSMYDVGRLGSYHTINGTDSFLIVNTALVPDAQPDFFPNGIYKIYILPCYCYSEVEYYGCFSEPYTLYYNYTPQNQGGGTDPELPSSFTLTNIQHPASTGYHTASVEFPEGFAQSANFSYGVKYKKQNSSTYGYGDLNLSVRSGSKYDVSIYAKDSNGTIYEPDPAYSVELDATYDNIPPSATVTNVSINSSTPNKIYLLGSTRPSDEGGSGMFVNEDGLIQFDYYLIKKETTGFDTHDEITRDKLEGVHKNTICYASDAPILGLEWDSYLEGYYILVLDLKDNNNNSALYSFVVMNITEAGIPKVWRNDKLYIEALKTHRSYSAYHCALNNDTWTERSGITSWSFSNSVFDGGRAYGHGGSNPKRFIKCAAFNNEYNSLFAFIYPDSFDRLNNGQNVSCSSKAVIPGLGDSYQVFYDAPCFAHTMAFPTELLAELNSKTNDALKYDTTLDRKTAYTAVWETKGREYGLKLLYGGESDANNSWLQGNTSYIAPVDEIPSGFSYVTVFHFADGTTAMSDVKQK